LRRSFRHLSIDEFSGADQINPGLRRLILDRERIDPGVNRSNARAWHSREDLLDWPGPEVTRLCAWISDGIRSITEFAVDSGGQAHDVRVKVGGWANVVRDGGYNKIHNHPDCTWSGVYYVSMGESDPTDLNSGLIEFLDPRSGARPVGSGDEASPKLTIRPVPGLMLMFPNWLYHYVNPFHGSGERISIAFNVRLDMVPAKPRR
jgi:uncharacterized protein (TIGR02466 family)